MAPQVADRAFERRFTTKEAGVGSGLGLALVRETVTRAGGSVELESRPGRGTSVRVLLPVAQGPASTSARVPVATEAAVEPGRMRAVVCCDPGPLGECVTELLRREGLRVERRTCSDAFTDEAGEAPDILLVETAAWRRDTRAEHAFGHHAERARTVWLTDGSLHPGSQALRSGDVVVEWPFSPDELLLEVRALCEGSSGRAAVH